jgi:hypothetical protein
VTKGDRGGMKGAGKGLEIKEITPCNAAAGCNECRTPAPGARAGGVSGYFRRMRRLFKACRDTPSKPAARP